MAVACLRFPGTNGERELGRAFEALGERVLMVDHRATALPPDTTRVVLPGGFSHGDALRAGALAARSPVMGAVRGHAAAGGFVLGICNGFQILCEAHLLPGALLPNVSPTFVARDARVSFATDSPLGPYLERTLRLPIAHAHGRYVAAPKVGTTREPGSPCVALRYEPADDPNPGGTGIAGLLGGARRNVFGLMPHPERRFDNADAPFLGADAPPPDGRLFFEAILRYDRERP